jgi:hypothetical protein
MVCEKPVSFNRQGNRYSDGVAAVNIPMALLMISSRALPLPRHSFNCQFNALQDPQQVQRSTLTYRSAYNRSAGMQVQSDQRDLLRNGAKKIKTFATHRTRSLNAHRLQFGEVWRSSINIETFPFVNY